jgi:NitT/TauT family transport system ATP-binding protein
MPVLALKGISKRFSNEHAQFQALADISCVVEKGEIVCLMGPSGCGKSTVIRILSGLETADAGTVTGSDGNPFLPIHTAMVFQEHGLFPWLSVYDNIAYGLSLKIRSIPKDQIRRKVRDLLILVHMEEFAHSFPHQLSGGMKQRVAVARALAVEPDILLMDEPFSALDPFSRRDLQDEVIRIRDTLHTTFFIVTHNPDEAVYLADRIIVLSQRPSRVIQEITVSSSRPRDIVRPEIAHLVRNVTGYVTNG